tara:strand:+ start:72 stop:584 length:513 start_codon:yes stop_codon:yes gene_type:complete
VLIAQQIHGNCGFVLDLNVNGNYICNMTETIITRDSFNKLSKEKYTIGQLANEFNVTPRALRFYEQKGLLSPERVGLSRFFSRRDRARLKLIVRGKRLGFALLEIKELLDLYDAGDDQVEQLKKTLNHSKNRLKLLNEQKKDIQDTILEMNQVISQLENLLFEKGIDPKF